MGSYEYPAESTEVMLGVGRKYVLRIFCHQTPDPGQRAQKRLSGVRETERRWLTTTRSQPTSIESGKVVVYTKAVVVYRNVDQLQQLTGHFKIFAPLLD